MAPISWSVWASIPCDLWPCFRECASADGARRGAVTGLMVGLLVGAAATTLVWLSSADERCNDCWVSATGVTMVLSAFGTFGLTLLGGVFGASAPGEIWNDIPVGAARRRHASQ